ncbi:MAG: DUF1345 domain-containing protein [Betaproteobacteria bacterium]|nr:DUF1345 domain-containing protein [Betaproteobacteria bacterium]
MRAKRPRVALNPFNANGRRRLTTAAAAGAVALLILPVSPFGSSRFLIAWITAVACFVALAYRIVVHATPEVTERSAREQDQSGPVLLALVLCAAAASLFAVTLVLGAAHRLGAAWHVAYVLLAGLAVFASWLLAHIGFAFHYAHRYYGDVVAPFGELDRGLVFPGKDRPDYLDFAYFAFVIAMTAQVSDVQVTTHRMRRLVLLHGVASFGFYTVILALAINIVASALA